MLTPDDGLQRLVEGNRRFASGRSRNHGSAIERRIALSAGQAPFAVILGCSDSRVPPELIFDQHLGDLFVIRVAGNVALPSQVGSVEFAVELLGARLIVVLGHSRCGAIVATLDAIESKIDSRSPNLGAIVDAVRPAVEPLIESEPDRDTLVESAIRANVVAAAGHLASSSHLLAARIGREELRVVGAEYAFDTGLVELLEQNRNAD